ncbi:hypothetical protein ABID52_001772 [Fictibacillus halophilus]|uniref:Uncharacterized protein n=1 Tax=Fictibacillus halophilus TaxID=1610490 RepID=A0ABV2LIP1_9BACL|nr:hypothetical protein [Fictibacillus halophilus]
MDLKGWSNPGRNIEDKLHEQFYNMVNTLQDKHFTKHRNYLQIKSDLVLSLGLKSDGQLSTIKNTIEDLGLVNRGILERRNTNFSKDKLLTDLGRVLFSLIEIENELLKQNEKIPLQISKSIEDMYKSFYTEALINYYFTNGVRDGINSRFHPVRAILKQLRKYGTLDFFEYYLLCTHIYEDDNEQQEKQFQQAIEDYRAGNITLRKANIIEQVKGHQYLPQWIEKANFIKIKRGTRIYDWQISENVVNKEIVDHILHSDFLDNLYKTILEEKKI